eukprot:1357159-Prymnesium_polylepis.1
MSVSHQCTRTRPGRPSGAKPATYGFFGHRPMQTAAKPETRGHTARGSWHAKGVLERIIEHQLHRDDDTHL